MKSDVLFEEVKKRVEQMPDLVKKVRALYLWNITKDGKTISQWSMLYYSRFIVLVILIYLVLTRSREICLHVQKLLLLPM